MVVWTMLMPTSISATESFGSSKGKKEKQTVRIEPRVFFLTNITGLFWQVLPQLAESTLWNAISNPEKHRAPTVVQFSRSLCHHCWTHTATFLHTNGFPAPKSSEIFSPTRSFQLHHCCFKKRYYLLDNHKWYFSDIDAQ